MTFLRGLLLTIVALLLISAAAAWYYLYGPNIVPSARLVPADTLAFANIPNAAGIATGYETSQLKKLVEAPQAQPIFDKIRHLVGDKNLALLKVLLPDFSGQSFVALTHFDPSKPIETGFIAAMKPKPGTDQFDNFVTQVNAAYPELAKETKTGRDKLLGVDYQWIEGNNVPGRICVARYHGWIVTAWGEASLQDWLERMMGKSATPSLADNPSYQKSLTRIGSGAQAVLYLDYHALMQLAIDHLSQSNPPFVDQLRRQISAIGATAIGASFENGDIVDHFSLLEPRDAQLANGLSPTPCAFETLKFTGPETLFYFAANVDWKMVWKNFQAQGATNPVLAPVFANLQTSLQSLAQSGTLDVQKNIIDALGSEYSVQLEWPSDASYPDLSIFLKVDKPDDFKPAIAALVNWARNTFATTAVITEMQADGHGFATLKTVRPLPVSPTITEDGDWFGLFLTETNAVRSMSRDEGRGLLHNDAFNRLIGDNRNGAAELVYLDTPRLVDQTYRTALPFVSMGAMFNPTLASLLKGRTLPPDLAWLAPMGPWGAVAKTDDEGLSGYSRSGIGNQGIFLVGAAGGSIAGLQMAGLLPHPAPAPARYTMPVPGNPNAPVPPPVAPGTIAPTPAPALPPAVPSSPDSAQAPSVPASPDVSPAPVTPPAPPAPAVPPAPASPPDATSPPAPDSTH